MGTVEGTAYDRGDSTVERRSVQDAVFKLFHERKDVTVHVQ